jgi:hypothetical protein
VVVFFGRGTPLSFAQDIANLFLTRLGEKIPCSPSLLSLPYYEPFPCSQERGSIEADRCRSTGGFFTRAGRPGRAYGDGIGFHVNLPHRGAFSPDAAYHIGSRTGMRFLEGAPVFAV